MIGIKAVTQDCCGFHRWVSGDEVQPSLRESTEKVNSILGRIFARIDTDFYVAKPMIKDSQF